VLKVTSQVATPGAESAIYGCLVTAVASFVCTCVSLSVGPSVSPEITAEPIDMPLDGALVWTQGTNQILDDGRPLTKGQF